jgi:CubicO group peptidase (beta-lactamase class C family)
MAPVCKANPRAEASISWGVIVSICHKERAVKSSTLVLILTLILGHSLPCSANTPLISTVHEKEKLKLLEKKIEDLSKNGQVSGSFLFARKGEILLEKIVGKLHPKIEGLISSSSPFNLASVSKQFTAMAIMQLHHQGKLKYDQKVKYYLPQFPYEDITIRHLLNHTSGMIDYEELTDKYWDKRDFINQDMMMLYQVHQPKLEFTPGEKFEYSNTGYVVLAQLVESISNQSLEDYSAQYIFEPLGMSNTRIFTVLSKCNDFKSRVYGQHENEIFDLYHLEGITGDGSVYSTANDLLKWHNGLLNNKLLPASLKHEGFLPTVLNDGSLSYYGFGWSIDEESPSIVAHSGSWVGFTTYIIRNIEKDEVLIFLTNNTGGIRFKELRELIYSALDTKLSYIL